MQGASWGSGKGKQQAQFLRALLLVPPSFLPPQEHGYGQVGSCCVHPCTPAGGTQQHRVANRGRIQQDGKWFPATSSQQRVWPARPDDTAGRRGWLLHGRACPSLFQCCCQALSRESEFHRLTGTLHSPGVIASLILSSTGGSAQDPAAALLRAAVQGGGGEMAAGCRAQHDNGKQGFSVSRS